MSSLNSHDLPLPYGWITQVQDGHQFYVDTKANPPRSIWVHPYEDEQYLKEHPEAREKAESNRLSRRPHSYSGPPSYYQETSAAGSTKQQKKTGFLSKLKDKAIGTKEEREAQKRHMAEMQAMRRQQQMDAFSRAQSQFGQPRYGGPQYGAPQYGAPYGAPQYGYGQGRRRGGGGGMALPLIGGLAGGMLLGSALDGGDNYYVDNDYNDYGGGDGGGDFGGGDFGGGDF